MVIANVVLWQSKKFESAGQKFSRSLLQRSNVLRVPFKVSYSPLPSYHSAKRPVLARDSDALSMQSKKPAVKFALFPMTPQSVAKNSRRSLLETAPSTAPCLSSRDFTRNAAVS